MKQATTTMNDPIFSILEEINKKLERLNRSDDDLWAADEIADYMKLSKKSVQNKILDDKTFPRSRILPTGGRRWVAKEVIEWAKKRP